MLAIGDYHLAVAFELIICKHFVFERPHVSPPCVSGLKCTAPAFMRGGRSRVADLPPPPDFSDSEEEEEEEWTPSLETRPPRTHTE